MTEPILRQFRQFARYNSLANARLYDACATLTDAARKQDRQAFFGSIHGTLNHILLGDRIWLARLDGGEAPSTSLDAILCEDFAELRAARVEEDRRLEQWVRAMNVTDLEREIRYVNNAGQTFADLVSLVLPHLFNHQTHHRGQVHDMLSQAGAETPVLDMHRVLKPGPDDAVAAA